MIIDMIKGVGLDAVKVSRIEEATRRWGERFLRRVFTEGELLVAGRRGERLASRFAAKEAFLKALGKGIFSGISLKEIEVVSLPSGAPALRLHGRAKEATEGIKGVHLSLSHEGGYSFAMVILEG